MTESPLNEWFRRNVITR